MGMTLLESARWYTGQGLPVIPVNYIGKDPIIPDWAKNPIPEPELEKYFANGPMNIGVVLGTNGFTDIDNDAIEALLAWPEFRIDTGMSWERRSKRASHDGYYSDPPLRSLRFLDPTGIDRRAAGAQSIP
jgi:hypothetical protein